MPDLGKYQRFPPTETNAHSSKFGAATSLAFVYHACTKIRSHQRFVLRHHDLVPMRCGVVTKVCPSLLLELQTGCRTKRQTTDVGRRKNDEAVNVLHR